jgi:N-acylneuraminate cytidylyltransferase/CMP-N,N'-diacetyllegionaminic acid synthase
MEENVLFVITARKGSKGVPNKNIKTLFGIPLLALKGLSALALTNKENVWLSTDSEEYAEIGKRYGITVPFLRPDYLAKDTSSSVDVVLHAMQHAAQLGKNYTMIALLEPTSPFIYKEHLKSAIHILKEEHNASGIVAVKKVDAASVFVQPQSKYLDIISRKIEMLKGIRRQDIEIEVTPSGGFYIAKWDDFLKHKTFYTSRTLSYLVPEECSLEIDSPLQFQWAEFLVKEKIVFIDKIT